MESKFFAEAISRRRIDAGLTQEALAQKAGINRTTYGSIERGQRTLTNENLVRLAIALEAHPDEILGEAFQVQRELLKEIEREIREEMGLPEREEPEESQTELRSAIDNLGDSIYNLFMILQPSRAAAAANFLFSKPRPLPLRPSGSGKPRRRASRPRKQKQR